MKSSVATIGKATRNIAKEFIETGAVNRRTLVASEVLDLSKKFVQASGEILQSPNWMFLYGDHRRDGKGGWGRSELTSRYRTNYALKEPTLSAMSLDAPKTGFHYDEIIADDLETERASATRDQIDKCWDFYRLLYSLLEPQDSYLSLISTRWHYDDIYSRILERNKDDDPSERFSVLIEPAKLPDGTLTYPTRFPQEVLDNLRRKLGSYIFSCQYELSPVSPEDRVFKEEWIRYADTAMLSKERKYRIVMGADIAYTEKKAIERGIGYRLADWTVVFTAAIDDRWNYILLDAFRGRVSKLEGVKEIFRQYATHKATVIGLQKQDKLLLEDTIEQYAFQSRQFIPRIEYIAYPNRLSKDERIITGLAPVFESGKIYLQPSMKWLEQELLDFPRGAHDDALDALANLVYVSRPATPVRKKTSMNDIQKRIQYLKRGIDYDDKGERSWKNL